MPQYDRELKAYMKEVNRYPVLTKEQEIEYAKKAKAGDKEAEHMLVVSNLKFVVKIANQFITYTNNGKYTLLDLIQEGNDGLLHAVTKFDHEKGYRFITYAFWWIRVKIMKYIIRGHSVVRIGTNNNEKKLFFKMGQIKNLTAIRDPELKEQTRKQLAEKLNTTVEMIQAMEERAFWGDVSIEKTIDSESNLSLGDFLTDENEMIETISENNFNQEAHKELEKAMMKLSEKERDIIRMRYLEKGGMTLQSIATKYGLSRERVRQIEAKVLIKLKKSLSNSKFGREIRDEMK